MRDVSHLLEKNIQQWQSAKIAPRKDGTKAYFCGWQLSGNLLTQAFRMIKLAKKHKADTPAYWSRFSEKGKRQRRTENASPECLDACKEYLAAESKMFRFVLLRSGFHCERLESGVGVGDQISESEKKALEMEYLSYERVVERRHKPHFMDTELVDWAVFKRKLWSDLYYLRPLGELGWGEMEEEVEEDGLEGGFLGHVEEEIVEEGIEDEEADLEMED